MTIAIKTGEPVSVVVDRLLAEAMSNARKDSRTAKGRNKSRVKDRSTKYVAGIVGLVE
jgi:hypothetical protein